ncbi:unnamed protein product [Prunus armeniaca]
MELKWVVDIWCRLFKHSVEELDLRGESSVDAEWIAYIGAFRYLRSLNLFDCRRLTTSALWPIASEAVRLLATAAEERGPKGGWRRLLKRRKGRGKLLRRWTMAKMVVELKRINRGKKVTGFIGRGRGSGWLLSWGSGFIGRGFVEDFFLFFFL